MNLISDDYVSIDEIDNCTKAINRKTSLSNDQKDSSTILNFKDYIVSSSETKIISSILRVIEGT